MRSYTRTAVLAGVAVLGALAAPTAASANGVTCYFEGVVANISPGVMLVGGGGSYTFESNDGLVTQCVRIVAQRAAPADNTPVSVDSKIVSSGTFTNTICGTGAAMSSGATLDYDVHTPGSQWNFDYHIEFTALQGRLRVGTVDGRTETSRVPGDDVDGYVTIVPTVGSCTAPGGVTQFDMAGAFTIEW